MIKNKQRLHIRVVSQLGDFTSALGKLVRVLYNPKNNVVMAEWLGNGLQTRLSEFDSHSPLKK